MKFKSQQHIIVDGLYGIQSYGDDAMLLSLVNNLKLKIPRIRFTVLSRHPDQIIKRYGIEAIHNLDHPEWVEKRGYWFYGFNNGQPKDHIDRIRNSIADSDLLIIGGGNLLIDITDDWLRGPIAWHWFSSEIARIYQIPYMLFANSIGPFRTEWGRIRSAHIVRGAAAVTVRDEESLSLVEQMRGSLNNVRLLPDPALALEPDIAGATYILSKCCRKPEKGKLKVGISVRDLSWGVDKSINLIYIDFFQNICNFLIEQLDAQIFFIPQCSYEKGSVEKDDRKVAQQVMEGILGKNRCVSLTEQYRTEQIMGFYKLMDIAVVTRLHGAVFSAAVKTPFIAVDYLPKVRGFLRHIAMESYAVTLDDLADIKGTVNIIQDILANKKDIIQQLKTGVERAKKDVQKHFDIIESLVNHE